MKQRDGDACISTVNKQSRGSAPTTDKQHPKRDRPQKGEAGGAGTTTRHGGDGRRPTLLVQLEAKRIQVDRCPRRGSIGAARLPLQGLIIYCTVLIHTSRCFIFIRMYMYDLQYGTYFYESIYGHVYGGYVNTHMCIIRHRCERGTKHHIHLHLT